MCDRLFVFHNLFIFHCILYFLNLRRQFHNSGIMRMYLNRVSLPYSLKVIQFRLQVFLQLIDFKPILFEITLLLL
jgi:hypothetical protein